MISEALFTKEFKKKIDKFEDNQPRQLVYSVNSVYRVCSVNEFKKDYSLTDQQFLVIARGSVSEVKSLSYTALDINYIDEKVFNKILERCFKLTNLINGFIRNLKKTNRKK